MKKPVILVVDDGCFMRNLLGNTIRNLGYTEVHYAEDGQQAIQKTKEIQPDIVTMDISMPGMDSLDALVKILEVSVNSKVIMVSGVSNQRTMKQAIQNGAVDFIKKPFDKVEVETKLKKYLET